MSKYRVIKFASSVHALLTYVEVVAGLIVITHEQIQGHDQQRDDDLQERMSKYRAMISSEMMTSKKG